MKRKIAHTFQKFHPFLLGAFFFLSLVLISCSQEQGNWTAVQQKDEYIYGVWHSASVKNAEQVIQKVSETVKSASVQSEESSTVKSIIETNISPEHLLPSDGEILDWVQARPPSTYEGKTLYRDRPTAPDLFYAYGFQQQAEVEYQTPRFGSRPLILLEIFDMGTPENAFGIYNFHVYPQVKFEWVGSKAILSGGYLRFSKGKYFIQIEGYEFATGIREAMVLLAKGIAGEIKDAAPKPQILNLLPNNKVSGSIKVFRSDWVLRQIYSTLPVNVPQLTDTALGISARYRDNADSKNWMDAQIVFIIRFPDPSAAKSAYTVYRDAVMAAAMPLEVGANETILVNEDFTPKAN